MKLTDLKTKVKQMIIARIRSYRQARLRKYFTS